MTFGLHLAVWILLRYRAPPSSADFVLTNFCYFLRHGHCLDILLHRLFMSLLYTHLPVCCKRLFALLHCTGGTRVSN